MCYTPQIKGSFLLQAKVGLDLHVWAGRSSRIGLDFFLNWKIVLTIMVGLNFKTLAWLPLIYVMEKWQRNKTSYLNSCHAWLSLGRKHECYYHSIIRQMTRLTHIFNTSSPNLSSRINSKVTRFWELSRVRVKLSWLICRRTKNLVLLINKWMTLRYLHFYYAFLLWSFDLLLRLYDYSKMECYWLNSKPKIRVLIFVRVNQNFFRLQSVKNFLIWPSKLQSRT